MQIERDFFRIEEFAEKAGLELDDLVHLGAQGKIEIHALANNWLGDAYVEQNSKWVKASPSEGILISGYVQIYPDDLRVCEIRGAAEIVRLRWASSDDDPFQPHEQEWEYRLREKTKVFKQELIVLSAQLPKLISSAKPEEVVAEPIASELDESPLGTRQRNNMLKVIATLAVESGYDLNHAYKAAASISSSMDSVLGSHLSDKTLANFLSEALSVVELLKKKPPQ